MSEQENRQLVVELLPFWINGSLSPDEQQMVEAALEQDPILQQEADMLTAIREGMKDQPETQSPGELGLVRLRRVVNENAEQVIRGRTQTRRNFLSFSGGIAAVLALFAVFGTSGTKEDVYELASSSHGTTDIVVMFQPDVTQASMASLLQRHELVIVDGPSAIGLYRLSSVNPETDLTQLAEVLRLETEVFETVELP